MTQSSSLFEAACQLIPGGVNSPVRAWKAVGGNPFFVARGKGCILTDVDGKPYIDYVCSWGPLILGHAHQEVVQAVKAVAAEGLSFGAPTEKEILLASLIKEAVPSIDKIRFVNSGTEATLSALRLARAYTKRDKIIKIIGGYHGHHDALLVQAGSGVATLSIPSTPGVPEAVVQDTLLVHYNDEQAVKSLFEQYPEDIAAIIIEPVAGNMGVVPPQPGYLEALRQITSDFGAFLIFDEVMTGFRIAHGGAQERYGVIPDLTTLGKIIGGGLPIGAYGGRADIMQLIAPEGEVYQAGTLSGNPIATAAGIASLQLLRTNGFYEQLEEKTGELETALLKEAESSSIAVQINRVGSMMTLFFSEKPITNFEDATSSDTKRFAAFWQEMVKQGIYLPPSAFEAWMISSAHSKREINRTIKAASNAFHILSQ